MKLIELFSGVGSQYRALQNIGINITESYTSEIDKVCLNVYPLLNNHTPIDLGDIRDITTIPQVDLLTYSFPCQDISNQGLGLGLYEGKKSSLLWEVGRILENNPLPTDLLMENVAAITQTKHIDGLKEWMSFLEKLGYINYLFKLNATDFGIPQNRIRVFMVSRLNSDFVIPTGTKTDLRFHDIKSNFIPDKYWRDDCLVYLDRKTVGKEIRHQMISKEKYKFYCGRMVVLENSIIPTLTAVGDLSQVKVFDGDRMRHTTPLESVRLMGFNDDDYEKIKYLKDNKLRFIMGNSIVVNVLEAIFRNMFL